MTKLSYKFSYYVLYVCIAAILAVLALFFMVGYNNPVGEYNSPENTNVLIGLIYIMFGVCVAVTLIGSFVQFITALRDNPKNALKSLIGIILFAVVLIVSYTIGSADPILTGTGTYTDASWLKITDMLIYAIYFLLAVAGLGVLVNLSGIFRR